MLAACSSLQVYEKDKSCRRFEYARMLPTFHIPLQLLGNPWNDLKDFVVHIEYTSSFVLIRSAQPDIGLYSTEKGQGDVEKRS